MDGGSMPPVSNGSNSGAVSIAGRAVAEREDQFRVAAEQFVAAGKAGLDLQASGMGKGPVRASGVNPGKVAFLPSRCRALLDERNVAFLRMKACGDGPGGELARLMLDILSSPHSVYMGDTVIEVFGRGGRMVSSGEFSEYRYRPSERDDQGRGSGDVRGEAPADSNNQRNKAAPEEFVGVL
jgi:hypothetical protein